VLSLVHSVEVKHRPRVKPGATGWELVLSRLVTRTTAAAGRDNPAPPVLHVRTTILQGPFQADGTISNLGEMARGPSSQSTAPSRSWSAQQSGQGSRAFSKVTVPAPEMAFTS